MQVYFNNTTDQTLYMRRRDELDQTGRGFKLSPKQTATLPLVGRDECKDLWVIVTEDGDGHVSIVKDPGQICWHDTITIP